MARNQSKSISQKAKKRRSKFHGYREFILNRWSAEKTLGQIQNSLRLHFPDVDLPKSNSQLCRFIQSCILEKENL